MEVIDPGDIVPVPEPAEPEPEPQKPVSRTALVLAVVALLVGGGLAIAYLAPQSNTPEDAVREMAQAVSDEDVIGMFDALAPSERRLVKDFVVDMAGELTRLEVFDDDLDLSGIDGVDVEIENLDLAERRLADGIALVTVRSGTIRYDLDAAELPTGRVIDEQAPPDDADLRESGSEPIEEFSLVTVEEDGEWHVSIFYSAAEAMREEAGAPLPQFGKGPAPEGHPSPDAAVRAAIDAATDLDARRAIALLPPDEGKVVRDYSSLFLERAEQAAAEADVEVSIDDVSLDTELEGDGLAVVRVRELEATFRGDGESGSVRWDGKCLVASDGGDQVFDTCEVDDEMGVRPFPVTPDMGFVTVERGGEWYVSPIRTVLRPILELVRAIREGDLESMFESLFGFAAASESSELSFSPSAASAQSTLRNALTAAKVAYVDAGVWVDDPAALAEIEPAVQFERADGLIEPFVVDVQLQGSRLVLATRDIAGACLYLSADGDGAVGYARDEACGPATGQVFLPSPEGWEE